MRESKLNITPENLIEKLPLIGPWSQYHLATIALKHYFKREYANGRYVSTQREVHMLDELGMRYWSDATEMYHKQIGYTLKEVSNTDYVNES